jgi:hypothetical protein
MSQMPTLVPGDLRDTFEAYLRFADYALLHGRDDWSPEYVAHVERGLEEMRSIGRRLDEIRAEDERAAAEEFERLQQAETPEGTVPWARY